MLVALTYHSKTAEVCSTDKNKRSYDFTVCLPFWDSLTGSQQQMLRLNTIVRSYRAGDDVIFSMPEKNGLFLVLSGGVRVFIATDTGREITLMSIVSGGCCMLNTLDSAAPGDTVPILQATSDAVFAYINIVALRPLCAESPVVQQFLQCTQARNVQTVLNNIEYYFFHPLRSCIARVVLESPMPTPRTALRASPTRRSPTTSAPRARSSAGSWRGCVRWAFCAPAAARSMCSTALRWRAWPTCRAHLTTIYVQTGSCQKANFAFWQLSFVPFDAF